MLPRRVSKFARSAFGANTLRARHDTPTDLNARVNPAAHCVVMAPPPGVNPGGHAASDAMYGDTTAADAAMNERFYSLYAKGKTPPGSSIPATTSNDTNTADDETNQRSWNYLPIDDVRAEFPALSDGNVHGWAFMENAVRSLLSSSYGKLD